MHMQRDVGYMFYPYKKWRHLPTAEKEKEVEKEKYYLKNIGKALDYFLIISVS
jgi:hypothetical protein